MKVFAKLFGITLAASLALVFCWAALLVVLTALALEMLAGGAPMGHMTTPARVGFPLRGYAGGTAEIAGLPVPFPVTSHFGWAADYFGGRIYHTGVDMAVPVGTPVRNVMAGQVTFAGESHSGYGTLVVVENQGVQVLYGHLSGVAVQPGEIIDTHTVIGWSGNTGWSTGPHLHWEVRVNGRPVDPLQFQGGER